MESEGAGAAEVSNWGIMRRCVGGPERGLVSLAGREACRNTGINLVPEFCIKGGQMWYVLCCLAPHIGIL